MNMLRSLACAHDLRSRNWGTFTVRQRRWACGKAGATWVAYQAADKALWVAEHVLIDAFDKGVGLVLKVCTGH